MSKEVSLQELIAIGLMLFALFFGAGNLIFPPALGQVAGEQLGPAIFGFLLTGVGLPLLGVMAISLSGSDDSHALASKAHPVFAKVLMISIYLTIGPLFAIPRTGAVSYEIGVLPFLSNEPGSGGTSLFMHTIIFFAITYWLALNPGKLVDRIGKILTPLLLLTLAVLVVQPLLRPLGSLQLPAGEYAVNPFFKGFKEGYLTMDALASVVFSIVIINTIKEKGIIQPRKIAKLCGAAGLIAAVCLAAIYVALAYIGATSVAVFGVTNNGGILLSRVANYYFGSLGNVILGLAITFACLTTSIGLVSSCATYFNNLFPTLTYHRLVAGFCLFSMVVANLGLTQLIAFSIPILVTLYPLVIVLILLTFADPLFKGRSEVYACSLLLTGIICLVDGLKAAGLALSGIQGLFSRYIPLYDVSFGWLVPAIIGAVAGSIFCLLRSEKPLPSSERVR